MVSISNHSLKAAFRGGGGSHSGLHLGGGVKPPPPGHSQELYIVCAFFKLNYS